MKEKIKNCLREFEGSCTVRELIENVDGFEGNRIMKFSDKKKFKNKFFGTCSDEAFAAMQDLLINDEIHFATGGQQIMIICMAGGWFNPVKSSDGRTYDFEPSMVRVGSGE